MLARLSYPLNRFIFGLLEKHVGDVRILQIGANDGRTADALNHFFHRRGWYGLLVEPVPRYFEMLHQEYAGNNRVTLRQVAIDPAVGERTIYFVDEAAIPAEKPFWRGLATMNRAKLLKHGVPDAAVLSEVVPTMPLSDLLSEVDGKPMNALMIDVEGWEPHVFASADFTTFRPTVIVYENSHLSPEGGSGIVGTLSGSGYRVFHFWPDSIALLSEMDTPGLFELLSGLEKQQKRTDAAFLKWTSGGSGSPPLVEPGPLIT